ncbi:uncharacterized protein LOC111295648 [Durio zibethinus]|uniref:Uncharacterized protein LOC111295648 n=1 Tax=Durio zibethinus TaxID=66656 RepID=A0A6P5YWT0_DURZI|nr:uncharacterized protein LOC111295648 [Durio zibethinus]
MQEREQGDARIYIVSTLLFACVVAGGAFLCLYMFRPEPESEPWYPVVGIILIGIPWIFWIGTYIYRCCAHCCCQSNGGNVNRVQSSLTKTQSYASAGPVTRSMHSSENEDSPLRSPSGDHRRVHFEQVAVMGSSKYNQNGRGGESPREDAKGFHETEGEGGENSHDNITSDNDYISAASRKGEAPLILSAST